jgi:hypothetical protein
MSMGRAFLGLPAFEIISPKMTLKSCMSSARSYSSDPSAIGRCRHSL